MSILVPSLTWYIVIQLVGAAALPLTLRFFRELPDEGYAFSKILGVFLAGLTLWLGTSYGLLRNEAGGAWLALGIVAGVSYGFGGHRLVEEWLWGGPERGPRGAQRGPEAPRGFPPGGARGTQRVPALQGVPALGTRRKYVIGVELLFFAAFAVWTWVRANDPAASHTEQPMDLMFMNSIWASPTFPPHDAWLSGYAISYYYFGYWLLTTLGRLANIPPAIAYTVGQASWYGLLLVGAFGVAYNLAALRAGIGSSRADIGASRADTRPAPTLYCASSGRASAATGLIAALFVGVIGNLQVIPEWLYANGMNLDRLAAWLDVNGFPENAQRSGLWHIGYDWWWWRSSRVISDRDLLGGHIEVIDEFPAFSYILGDNHPHVLAMPLALLVIAMALAVYLSARRDQKARAVASGEASSTLTGVRARWACMRDAVPMGLPGLALIVAASGSLMFVNTWDYPPYLLLLVLAMLTGQVTAERGTSHGEASPVRTRVVMAAAVAALFGVTLALGGFVVYLPYFLTAQSQAGGIVPNLFNPTRLQQAFLMFGVFLPALLGWLIWLWRDHSPERRCSAAVAGIVFGLPLAFLALSSALALGTPAGRTLLQRVELPAGATSYAGFILARWGQQPYTLLLFGGLLSVAAALVWRLAASDSGRREGQAALFVLLLAVIGLALVYVPEFLFLRDNFGTRMNTIFKFYYQAWLLLALVAAHAVGAGLFAPRSRDASHPAPGWARALFALTLALGAVALLYPVAGAYSKTLGFSAQPATLDSTLYVARDSPAEKAAADWVLYNTTPDALALEGKGASYQSAFNRISVMTGRSTLLGWDGHESQWRGEAFGEMARGRAEALETVYRTGSPSEIEQALKLWDIEYVYIGPTERQQYGLTPRSEERIAAAMDLVFEDGDVRVYKRRYL